MGCKPSSGALSATGASDAGSVQGGAPTPFFRPTDRAAAPTPARQTPVPASMQLPFGSSAFRPAPDPSLCLEPLVPRQASRDPFPHPPLAAPTVRLAVRLIEPGASQTDRPDRRLPELRSHLSLTPHSHEFENGLALRLPTPPPGVSASLGISDVPGQGPHPPQPVILQSPSPAERRCGRASVGRPVRYGGPARFQPSPSKASGILRSLEVNAPGDAHAGQEDVPSTDSPSLPESGSGSAPASADEETGADASGATPATGPGLALDRMRIFRRGR